MPQRRPKGTGSAFKRSDGRWAARKRWKDERGNKYESPTFYGSTKTEAVQKLQRWVQEGERLPSTETVNTFILYLLGEVYPFSGVLDDTLDGYRAMHRDHIAPQIGHVRLSELSVAHCDSVARSIILKGRSAKTARNVAVFLGKCLKDAYRLEKIQKPLHDFMSKVKVERKTKQTYDLAQIKRLYEGMKGNRVRPAVLLCGVLGLREGEAAGLDWSDIDLTAGTISVSKQYGKARTKTVSGTRVIPIPKFVQIELRKFAGEGPLMLDVKGEKRIHPSTIYKEVVAAMERSGLPRLDVHALRHSANNILKELGVEPSIRRDILGHSSTSVTEDVYSHTTLKDKRKAFEGMESEWENAL